MLPSSNCQIVQRNEQSALLTEGELDSQAYKLCLLIKTHRNAAKSVKSPDPNRESGSGFEG